MTSPPWRAAARFGALLAWGVVSLWIEARWAWAAVQVGIFALAAWRVLARSPWDLPRAAVPLAAAALWPLLQVIARTTVYPAATWSAALDWGTFFLVFVLACDLFADARLRRWLLQGAVLFGMAIAGAATVGAYACPGKVACLWDSGFSTEVWGPFVNRNQFCAWIELLLPAALYLAATDRKLRALFVTAAAVMTGSAVASASRAGAALIGVEIVLLLLALAASRDQRRRLPAAAAQFVLLAAVAVAVVGWQDLWGRWRNSPPEDLRKDTMRASLQMVEARPWTGSGLGTWSRVYPRYAGIDQGVFVNQAHNDWMQWAAEGGLPFFLALFFFAGLSWKPAVQSIYGVGMVVLLLHALVDYPMQQRPALAAWFFCIAGIATVRRSGRGCEP